MPSGSILRAATGPSPVFEVFSSIQGEGLFVGTPQVFCRFAGCPLRCRYCDTPASWECPEPGAARARVRTRCGETRVERGAPTAERLAGWVRELDPEHDRAVSLTGGEPLLHAPFLLELADELAPRALHLETAGAHPDALARVLDRMDHVSLDLKLPSDLDPPAPDADVPADDAGWRAARRRCLALLAERGGDGERTACAKLVVTGGRPAPDYRPLLADLAELAPALPVILQPVTPMGGVRPAETSALLALTELALGLGLVPRVLPQVHRVLHLA
ncbi:MAG TPA: 7-carboxy-7-deazaguanine synthase QueE [Planctomycetes bacterium]|nr:7-carboxy-7-deazaguanine synthase QueE [Planctomycetota bacterium]